MESKDKRNKERRRHLIVLMLKFMQDNGWINALCSLEQESTIQLNDWAVADNMNLNIIVTEFEEYYAMKFGTPPVLVKKSPNGGVGSFGRGKKGKGGRLPPVDQAPPNPPSKGGAKPQDKAGASGNTSRARIRRGASAKGGKRPTGQKSGGDAKGLEIEGEKVSGDQAEKKESEEDYFKNRVLKGIPDYFLEDPQLRQLAQGLQRDIIIANPDVKFKDIVGLNNAKKILREAVKLPILFPELFTGLIEPWKGVLLFGPPGTGKTMLAKAVASECQTIFFNISASSIVSKWQGESEKLVRVLFDLARHHQPSTIFLDEIDSIMSKRSGNSTHEASRRLKTELLIQMDGLQKNNEQIFVLAASNLPWDLDEALLRRLEKRIYVPLPSVESRENMIRQFIPNRTEEVKTKAIADQLELYSGSDIKSFCKEALMRPLRRFISKMELPNGNYKKLRGAVDLGAVTQQDIENSLEVSNPSPAPNDQSYRLWFEKYGSTQQN